MSRAYKCEICGGLFEGEPKWDSVPVQLGGKLFACIDFAVSDLCPKCRQMVLNVAADLIHNGEIEVKDGG